MSFCVYFAFTEVSELVFAFTEVSVLVFAFTEVSVLVFAFTEVSVLAFFFLQFKIRREAVLGLGGIYKSVMCRDPVDPQQAARVDWIRNKVFHHYYHNSNDDRCFFSPMCFTCDGADCVCGCGSV